MICSQRVLSASRSCRLGVPAESGLQSEVPTRHRAGRFIRSANCFVTKRTVYRTLLEIVQQVVSRCTMHSMHCIHCMVTVCTVCTIHHASIHLSGKYTNCFVYLQEATRSVSAVCKGREDIVNSQIEYNPPDPELYKESGPMSNQ